VGDLDIQHYMVEDCSRQAEGSMEVHMSEAKLAAAAVQAGAPMLLREVAPLC
jgi:hypothetical protein